MDRFLSIKAASKEKINASPRWLREQLKNGLRHIRVGGKLLIKESWLVEYLERFEVNENHVGDIVDEICTDMRLK